MITIEQKKELENRYVAEFSREKVKEIDPPHESPFGGQGKCPVCPGSDIRVHFPGTPVPIHYCPDCLSGVGAGEAEGLVVDMHIFEEAMWMQAAIRKARKEWRGSTPSGETTPDGNV